MERGLSEEDQGIRLVANEAELFALREALLRLFQEDPTTFEGLFAAHLPLGGRPAWPAPADEIARWLRAFRLVEECGDRMRGRSRIRVVDGRLYVLDPGYVRQYYQDLWPETDVLLDVLHKAPPGALLDVGTGCGILAIEGAVRGHRAVATDLYESALQLARFNAGLNGVSIDLRQGHLLDPVRGEHFDLVLVLPHYTRVADQLRLEVLRAAPAHVQPGGTLAVAVPLEWEEEDAVPAAADVLLRGEAARGSTVRVVPITAALKHGWFTRAVSEGGLSGLTSRHRFLITIIPGGGGGLEVVMPGEKDMVARPHAPLARLGRPGRTAVVATMKDVARLEQILAGLDEGLLTLSGPLPADLLDACRYGARPCVTARVNEGAAGAILDRSGGVRPCTHGAPFLRAEDTMASVAARWAAESDALAARRGCASCPAATTCSRCMFPYPLDETAYCDLIRARVSALPLLHRLLRFLSQEELAPPLRIRLRPGAPPLSTRTGSSAQEQEVGPVPVRLDARMRALSERLWASASWLIVDGAQRHLLSFLRDGELVQAELDEEILEVAELVADGASAADLLRYLRARRLPPRLGERALSRLAYALR